MFKRFSQKIEFLIYKSNLIIFFDLKKSDPPSPSLYQQAKQSFRGSKCLRGLKTMGAYEPWPETYMPAQRARRPSDLSLES
jgi:hypothetical protein